MSTYDVIMKIEERVCNLEEKLDRVAYLEESQKKSGKHAANFSSLEDQMANGYLVVDDDNGEFMVSCVSYPGEWVRGDKVEGSGETLQDAVDDLARRLSYG